MFDLTYYHRLAKDSVRKQDAPFDIKAALSQDTDEPRGDGAPLGPSELSGEGNFVQQGELRGHGGAVYAVKYAPSGGLLASASFDKTIRVWSSEQQTEQVLSRASF